MQATSRRRRRGPARTDGDSPRSSGPFPGRLGPERAVPLVPSADRDGRGIAGAHRSELAGCRADPHRAQADARRSGTTSPARFADGARRQRMAARTAPFGSAYGRGPGDPHGIVAASAVPTASAAAPAIRTVSLGRGLGDPHGPAGRGSATRTASSARAPAIPHGRRPRIRAWAATDPRVRSVPANRQLRGPHRRGAGRGSGIPAGCPMMGAGRATGRSTATATSSPPAGVVRRRSRRPTRSLGPRPGPAMIDWRRATVLSATEFDVARTCSISGPNPAVLELYSARAPPASNGRGPCARTLVSMGARGLFAHGAFLPSADDLRTVVARLSRTWSSRRRRQRALVGQRAGREAVLATRIGDDVARSASPAPGRGGVSGAAH
ncbi:hypothetical protein HBB16_05660 [Pseudonocardia sp. MCCB 268]|nr:hypothetical protein [Pseudonocardia cytotoxica]